MPNKLSTLSNYVRMSWAPENLYNLYRLSVPEAQPQELGSKLSFKRTSMTLYQQKWSSKRLLRAYHGDWITERRFKRRFLPNALPPLQATTSAGKGKGRTNGDLEGYALEGEQEEKKIPLGSLMWREVEARLDVLVFRACLAHSIYEARRLVLQGHVKLNGKIHRDPNILLEPGDLLSVDPKEMYLLRQSDHPFEVQKSKSDAEEAVSEDSSSDGKAEAAAAPSAEAEASSETATATTEATGDGDAAQSERKASPGENLAETQPAARKTKTASKRPKVEVPGLPFDLPDFAAPFLFIPAYLEVSFPTCSAIYVRHPTARPGYSEIPTPYDADGEVMRLGWEYYKGVGRRRRNLSDHGDAVDPRQAEKRFDDKGRRLWGKDWEESIMEKRRMRGVRMQWGRWTNRPI